MLEFTCTPRPRTSPSLCVYAHPMESTPAHHCHPDWENKIGKEREIRGGKKEKEANAEEDTEEEMRKDKIRRRVSLREKYKSKYNKQKKHTTPSQPPVIPPDKSAKTFTVSY